MNITTTASPSAGFTNHLTVISKKLSVALIATVICISFSTEAVSQTRTLHEDYNTQTIGSQHVASLGVDSFGDMTDWYTGTTGILVTDVSLQGNSDLAVALQRKFSGADDGIGALGWSRYEVPYMSGIFKANSKWQDVLKGYSRCSTSLYPPEVTQSSGHEETFQATEYWHGTYLYAPGQGTQLVTGGGTGSITPVPTDGRTYELMTNKRWHIACLSQTKNGEPGEGYLAISPNGTKYYFDWLINWSKAASIKKDAYVGGVTTLNRDEYRMLATRIEDRFGNWVNYTYSGKDLVSITSNDGRSLTISYASPGAQIQSVTDGTRVWTYDYSSGTRITAPDGSTWSSTISGTMSRGGDIDVDCIYLPSQRYSGTAKLAITLPSGAVGEFEFAPLRRGLSYVPFSCIWDSNYENGYPLRPRVIDNIGLYKKTISGPGLETQTWTIVYGPANPCFIDDIYTGKCEANSPTSRYVEVYGPNSTFTRYTYGNKFRETDALLQKIETGSSPNNILRTANYAWDQLGPAGFPASTAGDNWVSLQRRFEKRIDVIQSNTTYTKLINSRESILGLPTSTTRSSTPGGYTRTDVTAYHHNTAKWVIGQVASSANSNTGVIESRTDYDATTALPIRVYGPSTPQVAGKLQQTLTYNPDGTLLTAKDGNNNVTTFGNWKRGLPQKITFADTQFKSAVVNDLGQITSVTDENAHTTSYAYDPMGRLSKITYPTGDSTAWNVTNLAFVPVAAAEVGIPAGHWRQTVSTGNGVKLHYFDALWRPLVTREYDAGNVAGTQRFQRFTYDHEGRTTFASYSGTTDARTTGIRTTYDALGRPTLVRQDSELGVLQTQTAYLNSGSAPYTRIIDPRGNPTNLWHQSFDVPSLDAPIKIQHPEGAYTEISRDVFGKPTALTRRNADGTVALTRSYTYDAHQQLCASVEPETRATVMDYDGAGQLAWSAGGRALTASTLCNDARTSVADADRIKRSYDARLRLKTLSFPGGNGNQVWTYTPDGLPSQITTANDDGTSSVVNAYGYNKRRLLTSESQTQLGMPTWSLGYGYDGNGALASHTYPSGLAVAYAPNALGQPTRAGTYATGVSYWPNGAMKQFSYGNGIVHTMTQNARQLPEQSIDSGGVLNDSYDYDPNGNVLAISDGLSGARGNRDMTYDGLDRLKTTTSPMFVGGAAYSYDVLDNLTRVKAPGRDHYYCYDTRRVLTNVKTGSCAGTSVIGLDYDPQGNLANKNGVLHNFDAGNRLREVVGKETYRYDGYGRRVSAQSAQGAIYSLYGQDGALRYQRDERKAQAYDYISLNGSLLARVTSTAVVVGVPIVTAPVNSSTGSYTVSWTPVTLATGYEAQEAFNGGAWQAAYTGTATSLARSGQPAGSYGYRVRACRGTTCGSWSATATTAVNVPPASAPVLTAPATAANGNYSVTWTTVGGATSYTLEQSANDGAWSQAYSGAGISQSYSAKPAGSYGYRVKACNPVGCSGYSATKTVQAIWPPGAPTLSAPAQSTNGSYTVSWTSVSGASGYRLEERVGTGAWSEIQNSTAVSKAFTGKADGSYGYRARACNAAGCGGYSATATLTVLTPPTAVATITTPATNTTGAYTVSWTAVAKATTYTLQRSANGGAWASVYTGPNRTFAVSGQGEGSYGYRVQGCNGSGCGGWSATKTTQVNFVPAMPSSLTGRKEDGLDDPRDREYFLYWSASVGATYYELQKSSGSQTTIYTGPNLNFRFVVRSTSLSFRVRACNPAGCSAWKGPLTL